MPSAVIALNVADLSAPSRGMALPAPPTTVASPSNHPCMIRVAGLQSRYRNDPYGAPVLPPIQTQQRQSPPPAATPSTTTHRSGSIPPAFQMASRTASRVKSEIARAATFTAAPLNQEHREEAATTGFQHHGNRQDPIATHAQWCFVRLKHEVLLYNAPFAVEVGDSVVMEGDRGENIGTVQRLVGDRPRHPIQCSLLRFANDEDLDNLQQQRNKEELSKHFAQGVSDALGLSIRIVDTEFQSDGNKLTVYFASRRMIDFRKLQRQLFKQYRCRIWLVNWADVIKVQQ